MKNTFVSLLSSRSAAVLAVALMLTAAALWSQQLFTTLKVQAAQDSKMRVSESNSCTPASSELADTPHFSGCSSII